LRSPPNKVKQVEHLFVWRESPIEILPDTGGADS
jgi:hypothetical protein